jgi:DNA modification methylase
MFSRIGDLVLDPFAGYGSILLACELFERRWLGIELDRVKYEIAKRIIAAKRIPDIAKLKAEYSRKPQIPTLDEWAYGLSQ